MRRHRQGEQVRLRPVRAVWFAASSTLTLLAVVAVAGLLPVPSVAGAAGSPHPATAPPGWEPLRPLTVLTDRMRDLASVEPQRGRPARGAAGAARPDGQPPPGSGTGKRVVFDLSAQRVWLVRDGGSVRDTYLVSGSTTGNLQPGRYGVYSRSGRAVSFDYASTMRWMVRFTEGERAAIGFHAIPRDADGDPLQTVRQLGTPQSHGCIRQRPGDARTLWRFAPVGTRVVVVA